MARFIALTSRGLTDVLERELQDLNLKVLKKHSTSILFESNWKGCYRANLCLRSATRILLPVLDFPAYDFDEIYHNCMKHDFTKYISIEQTLAVDVSLSESGKIKNQQFAALRIKDAIVDQFVSKQGARPSVDVKNPDLKIVVRIVKNQVSLSIDTSGKSLSKRGYRKEKGLAPLREHLAAGLVLLSGWTPDKVLIDPMCGSGTILTEAALLALNFPPGFLLKKFAFQGFKNFQADDFKNLCDELELQIKKDIKLKIFGFDIDPRALAAAKENIEEAELEDYIQIKQQAITDLRNPVGEEAGIMIINPPYGERVGFDQKLAFLYRDFSHILKQNFKGWDCWLLSGNQDLTTHIGMKSERRYSVFNGNIECRFLKYEVRK